MQQISPCSPGSGGHGLRCLSPPHIEYCMEDRRQADAQYIFCLYNSHRMVQLDVLEMHIVHEE